MISCKSQLIALCSKTHHVEDASTWLMTRPCAMSTYSHGVTCGGGVSSGWGGGTDDFLCAGGYLVPPLRARHDLWHALPRPSSAADGRAFGSHTTKGMA